MTRDDPRPERFAAWRRRLGLTQAQLAERMGVSVRAVQAFERGRWLGRKPIGERAWRNAALAAAAVTLGIRDFDFETLTVEDAPHRRHVRLGVVSGSARDARVTATRATGLEELQWPSALGQG